MQIRIKSLPNANEFEEYDLSRFRAGEVYEVSPGLASLLIVAGHAESVTQRQKAEAADWPRKGKS